MTTLIFISLWFRLIFTLLKIVFWTKKKIKYVREKVKKPTLYFSAFDLSREGKFEAFFESKLCPTFTTYYLSKKMSQWVGYLVSIKCGDELGTFQGEIKSATNSLITLTKAFCNGFPCGEDIEIRASDIVDLKLIDKQTVVSEEHSTITIAKPIAKRVGRAYSTSEVTNVMKNVNLNGSHSKSKPIDIEYNNKHTGNESSSGSFSKTPNNKQRNKKWNKSWKDEECFGSPLDQKISKDFDFEKNLALFNKQAIWDELNAQNPNFPKQDNKKQTKYRHDENVIATLPASLRQISVPKQDFCEYVTDDGLIIPSISRSLRRKLWDAADKVGLTWERRIELTGRAATEISIQLLGGGHRLNPHNTHQWPTVVVLCGPHKHGAVGVNTARHLASHGVRTVVFTTSVDVQSLKKELSLYTLTKNRVLTNVSELPNTCDLVICALCEDSDSPKPYPLLAEWVARARATVVAVDPPPAGTPGFAPKYSLVPVLPLPHGSVNGKLYLCNLGFPVEVFNEVGIMYKSPFGPKFVIPLHPQDE